MIRLRSVPSGRYFIDHGNDSQQHVAADSEATVLYLLAVKRSCGAFALDDDFDSRAGGAVLRRAGVNANHAAIETMEHQSAFYFLPNLVDSGVEFFSHVLVFHGGPSADRMRWMIRAVPLRAANHSAIDSEEYYFK